jgi:hypothetical protein
MPAISIEVICPPRRECSRVKSSKKVSRTARDRSGQTSEELALPTSPTGLDDCLLLFGLAGRRLFALHFLERIIAAPFIALRTSTVLVWGNALNAGGENGKLFAI